MADSRTLARVLCDKLNADELDLLLEDPIEAIPLIDPAVSISLVSYEPGEGCSVEGLYHEATRSLTVQRAASRRRTRFTALHEFGHDRARHDKDVARYLASLGEVSSRKAEERVADAFAAAVLIPDSAVEEILSDKAPTAYDVVRLFQSDDVGGSREACCVRVSQKMGGEGYVVLAEGDVMRFCATVGGAYPIRRGASQAKVGLLHHAARRGAAKDPNTKLQFSDGRFTGVYAGQAVTDDIYTFAVLTDSTTPPWGGWIAPRLVEGEAPEIFCQECDDITEAWRRCTTNPSHRVCSNCGWCECHTPRVKVPEKICGTCQLSKRVDLFPENGATCRDCL
jgi:hypothetical protein